MKGMIFAAGLGTRLGAITQNCPKALVEVGGKPMIERVIRNFVKAGITEIVVNVHHHADMLTDYLQHNDFGADIIISDERKALLDTGGGILACRDIIGEDAVLMHNSDILTNLNLNDIISQFENCDCDAMLAVWNRKSSRKLFFDSNGFMQGWINEKSGEIRPDSDFVSGCVPLAFSGVHILSKEGLDKMALWAKSPVFSIMDYYVGSCRKSAFKAYIPETEPVWHDIGKPESLDKARSETVLIQ